MHPYLSAPRPHLFGHRGASGEVPENTLPSFERALQQGATFLEMDCHCTQDGEIVVLHDAAVDRVTDGEGPVSEFSYSELQRLDAGYGFTPDGANFPFRGCGIRIPRLVEVLEAFPSAPINLEIKRGDTDVIEEVLRQLGKADAIMRVLLAAEDDALMTKLRGLDPGTAIGSSRRDVVDFFKALREERLESFEPQGDALQIPPGFMERPLVTRESVQAAHLKGLCVHVWTINQESEMNRLLDLGVDGIMSDFPARLVEVVRRRSSA